MLSILIPVYNYNVVNLVNEIHKQATQAKIEFEIICIDDASKASLNKENEKINSLKNSIFFSNKKNLGYSSNRNFLVSKSKFENLIFIDGDSIIVDKGFINKYLNTISKENDIIYGGRIHPIAIENPNKKLRWKYGKFIEDKSATIRSKNSYITLMFNNTCIKKSIFNSIKFDSCTNKYGHDDTLFSYKASLKKVKIKHIDNAVMHGDIDTNNVFIKKTETALNNLLHLYNLNKISTNFVKILKLYKILYQFKIHIIISFLFKNFKPLLKNQLNSHNPSLLLFNIYKIGFFCFIASDEDYLIL